MIYSWLSRHMWNRGLGGPAVTLHMTFQWCGGLAPQPLYCLGINCIIQLIFVFFLKFINFSWRLITLQYCSGFCHTSIWTNHGYTCVPHPEPPSHLPPHPILPGHPSAPAPGTLYLLDLHKDFSGGMSGDLVVPSLEEFSTVCCDLHTVKGFGIVNKAKVDVFLELSCFFSDPVDVGSLISGSSAFSK